MRVRRKKKKYFTVVSSVSTDPSGVDNHSSFNDVGHWE